MKMAKRGVSLALVMLGGILSAKIASATTYQDGTDIKFTFRPTLSVALSSEGITISDLTPGQSGVSSPVDVTVNTNNIYGYTMNATVGSSAKNYRELKHTNGTDQFTSVAVGSGLAAIPTDGGSVWGFASSTDGGQTWSKYTGLPKYDDTNNVLELNHASAAAGGDVTKVRIGAYAVTEQVAGDYTNVINFAVVTNVVPVTYMQQMTYASCPTDGVVAYDARDEKAYRVRKITTGGDTLCWMTDNLDLAGGTALYSDGSNVPDGYLATSGDAYYTLPGSSTSGFSDTAAANVYNSDSKNCGDGSPCYSYYSYAAATAGTNPSAGAATSDICPKGWRLPTQAEFNVLKDTYTTGTALTAAPFRGVYAGYYLSSSFYDGGSYGVYWSSTATNTSGAYALSFISSSANTYDYNKNYGFSVRCVMRNPNAYNISYDKNTADSVTDMPSAQVGDTANATITIPATAPTRDGYNFLGWCNTATTTTNGTDSCSGTVYNPNGGGTNRTIVLTPSATTTVTLRAMWQRIQYTVTITLAGGASGVTIGGNSYTTSATLIPGNYTISGSYNSGYEFDSWATSGSVSVASASSASTTLTVSGAGTLTLNGKSSCSATITGTMQDFKPCSSITNGTTGTLTDSRDGTSYAVGKLADGKFWLLDNLALDLTDSTILNALSTSNTNASAASLTSLRSGNRTAGYQYATAGVANWTSSYSYSAPLIATSGTGNNGDWTKDTLQSYGSGSGKIGVYYNYCAASAGSYCYGNGTSAGSPSGNATEDICPKGWRMPTSDSSGEYQALYAAYSSNVTNFKNALRTPLSGSFYDGSAGNQGSRGDFWSSTYDDRYGMYSLGVTSSSVYPQVYYTRGYGLSVRCVLQASDISQISTMQDFATNNASAIKDSMATGQAYTLTDSRDGTSYTVSKLADGKVWLLDNLALDLTNSTVKANLSATNTNASATTLNYLKNGGGTTSDKYATAGVANWTSNSYSAPLIATSDTENGGWTKDTLQSYGSGYGKIGVYYNYCAASAGSYCYGNGTGYGYPSGNATEDICPKGWRMPTGGSSGEYQALYTAYSSDVTNFMNALRTPLSGRFDGASAYGQGIFGVFWSSTYEVSNSMHCLNVNSSYAYPQHSNYRDGGDSVRCVLQ